jgi:hypothetical protein
MRPDIEKLCGALQGLLDGACYHDDARSILESMPFHGLDECHANLFHYLSDGDIRQRDEAYRKLQDSEMEKLIKHLRANNFIMANRITFLEKT